MAESNIFAYPTEDIDLKDPAKITLNPCNQFDDIILSFNILDDGIAVNLTNYTIEFRIFKPDDSFIIQNTDIIKLNNNITITCKRDMTRMYGRLKCALRLIDANNKQKSSFNIIIPVNQDVINENSVGSQNIVTVTEELNTSIVTGTTLHTNLTNDISTGQPLHTQLRQDITDGNAFKDQLNADVAGGKVLQPQLQTTVDNANTAKTNLDTSLSNALPSINKINGTFNKSVDVLTAQWVGTEPNLTFTINHGLNTENLVVSMKTKTTKISVLNDFRIIDTNNIEVRSTTKQDITVVINASYYSAGADIAQEVKDARGTQANLKANIDLKQNKTDNTLTTTSKEIVGAINENKSNIDLKANNTDNARTTTAKDVTGAINELNGNMDYKTINIMSISEGTITTLPTDCKEVVIIMTVNNNYKLFAKFNIYNTDTFTVSFSNSVDQGAGYDEYVTNFTYSNRTLSFQKNMRFQHSASGSITRIDIANATDKTIYPKITHVLYK